MISIFQSSLGGSYKINGKRYPTALPNTNHFRDILTAYWPQNARILFLSASPDNYERNDTTCGCLKMSFPMSGLAISKFDICDSRNESFSQNLGNYDVLILGGGHVPTQNHFFQKLNLRENLKKFDGLLLSWSAGSMNCAETVYAMPEQETEAIDPNYQRFLPGLGLTSRMIIPHYQEVKNDIIDGLHAIEDIALPDSNFHPFYALTDGSYILSVDGKERLYGEAYLLQNGTFNQICNEGKNILL